MKNIKIYNKSFNLTHLKKNEGNNFLKLSTNIYFGKY